MKNKLGALNIADKNVVSIRENVIKLFKYAQYTVIFSSFLFA